MPTPLVKVLYEDDSLIGFDKPSGILSIPSPHKDQKALTEIVNSEWRTSNIEEPKLHPCHRLDKETSGAILFAKGKKNQQLMMDLFRRQAVKKIYIAFIRGRLKNRAGELKSRISDYHERKFRPGSRHHRTEQKTPAVTRFSVISEEKEFSVIEVCPLTGQTNQIRIQFREIGHPLLGERVYAFRKDFPVNFRRLALHAREISFIHPVSSQAVTVKSGLPEDMKAFLKKHSMNTGFD